VAAEFCEHCASDLTPGAAYCAACGAPTTSLSTGGRYAPTFPPAMSAPPAGAYPAGFQQLGAPSAASDPEDARALSSVVIAALLAVVSSIVSLVVAFSGALSASVGATSGSAGSVLTSRSGATDIEVVAAFVAVAVVEIYLYRRAFTSLEARDRRFHTPARLALLLLVSLVLLLVLFAWTISILVAVYYCAGGAAVIPASCVPATVFAAAGLLILFAVLAVVGYIGILIGIWRLGTRYGDDRFKLGAILLIIPVLDIVGAVLILLAARSASAETRRGPPWFSGPTA
jgi:Protein of unknown function (DUF973)